MNQLQTQPAPAGVHQTFGAVRVIAIAALTIAALLVILKLVEGPRFVDHVTVVNNTRHELDIDTAASPTDGWTPAGVAIPRNATEFFDVIDHGHTWWVRVSEAGHSVTFPISRAQLAGNGWRVEIPASVDQQLTAARREAQTLSPKA